MLACGCDRCGHSGREITTKIELRRLTVNETDLFILQAGIHPRHTGSSWHLRAQTSS
jgi:hypothetical protein